MLGDGYWEVNQGQSSDPPALFRTSKAFSSLLSQYSLAAISAVSPDGLLCMYVCLRVCGCVCELWVWEIRDVHTATHTHNYICLTYSSTWIHTAYVWGWWFSLATSWLRVFSWGSMDQCTPAYSCLEVTKQNWVTQTCTQTCTERPLGRELSFRCSPASPPVIFLAVWSPRVSVQQSTYIPLVNMISEGLLEGNLLQFTE